MKSNIFSQIEVQVPDTNTFDLSHDNKLSLDMGQLVPVLVMPTLPGDSFNITPQALVKFAPMTFPVMHKIDVYIHLFYVTKRNLWRPYEEHVSSTTDKQMPYFQGNEDDPENIITLEVPEGGLLDYMGLPTTDNILLPINALPIMAYYNIVNQYYQDQNNDEYFVPLRNKLRSFLDHNGLITPAQWNLVSPSITDYEFQMGKRCFEHDLYTSALPFAQKGPAVTIPISLNDLPVEVYQALQFASGDPAIDGTVKTNTGLISTDDGVDQEFIKFAGLATADNASLTGDINDLRISYALQRFLEKNARGGTRYPELIQSRWGVNIGDASIQRPVYIGGVKNNVVISEVLQTSQTVEDTSALGEYAGHGVSMLDGNSINYYCPESGYIIGIMSVRPKTAYFQGIPKFFRELSTLDEIQPEFAHIGEQEILNSELYYDKTLIAQMNDGFGYVPYAAHYKFINSGVHGQFRSSLLDWHLARKFDNLPQLNVEFVNTDAGKRIFAVTDPEVQSLYAHVYFNISARRKLPFYSTPI